MRNLTQRFTHEAQALARSTIRHCENSDFGQAGGFYFLLMEFVDGVNLRQAMKAGRLHSREGARRGAARVQALQYAHEHGIVHRGHSAGEPAARQRRPGENRRLWHREDATAETRPVASPDQSPAGSPVNEGTLASAPHAAYMAPGAEGASRTDHRATSTRLGVVLYELLTANSRG